MLLGMIFEDRKKAMRAEILRFLLTLMVTGYLAFFGLLPVPATAAIGVFGIGSVWILQRTGLHELVEVE
jgi:hypothetical protein